MRRRSLRDRLSRTEWCRLSTAGGRDAEAVPEPPIAIAVSCSRRHVGAVERQAGESPRDPATISSSAADGDDRVGLTGRRGAGRSASSSRSAALTRAGSRRWLEHLASAGDRRRSDAGGERALVDREQEGRRRSPACAARAAPRRRCRWATSASSASACSQQREEKLRLEAKWWRASPSAMTPAAEAISPSEVPVAAGGDRFASGLGDPRPPARGRAAAGAGALSARRPWPAGSPACRSRRPPCRGRRARARPRR